MAGPHKHPSKRRKKYSSYFVLTRSYHNMSIRKYALYLVFTKVQTLLSTPKISLRLLYLNLTRKAQYSVLHVCIAEKCQCRQFWNKCQCRHVLNSSKLCSKNTTTTKTHFLTTHFKDLQLLLGNKMVSWPLLSLLKLSLLKSFLCTCCKDFNASKSILLLLVRPIASLITTEVFPFPGVVSL